MKKLLIPILLLIAQYSFSQVIPQKITVLNSGGGSQTHVKAGYGMKVDSVGGTYVVNADSSVLKNTTNLHQPLFFNSIDTSINFNPSNLPKLSYSLVNRDTTTWNDTTLVDKKFLTARINAIPSSPSSTAQTTLVAGTKAISITGVTASSKATVSFVSIGGTVSTTWMYAIVCTSGTVTITALTNSGTTNTLDTSLLTYTVTP